MWILAAIAVMNALYVEEEGVFDSDKIRVGSIFRVSNPRELELLQPENGLAENVIVDLLDWQVLCCDILLCWQIDNFCFLFWSYVV